jgi:putative salt-induced outer membrane protein YdiY
MPWAMAVRIASVALCFWLALAGSAQASILVLSNGDRLTGEVVKQADGKIYFHSDVLGDIVAPANGVTIEDSPASPTSVNSLVGLPPPSASRKSAGLPKQPSVVKLPVTPWTGKIEFGYDNSVSNDIRTINTVFRADAARTVRTDDLLMKARLLYNVSGGVAATDQYDAEFRWRHNLSDRIFSQSDTTYDVDKIRQINYEAEENAGLGYRVVKSLRQNVDVGVGAIGQELDAVGIQQGLSYLGNVFQDYTYQINGRYTLTEDFSAQISPEDRARSAVVTDTAVFQTGSERDYDYKFHTSLQGKISKHLSLNLHFEYEFDNAILETSARGSQRVTTTLGYGF